MRGESCPANRISICPPLPPLATLAGTQLAYIERGAHTKTDYDDFFPSLNGAFLLRPNLIARFSYGRSISRPFSSLNQP